MKHLAVLFVLVVACKKKEAESPPPSVASGSPVAIDAPAPAAPKLVISSEGVGPLERLAWDKQSVNETAALISNTLAPVLPGITVTEAFLPVPGKPEAKGSYWSVKRGSEEIMQVLGKHPTAEVGMPSPAMFIVRTPEIPTATGIKVGDTVADLLAKHPVLFCFKDPNEPMVGLVPVDVTCHDKIDKRLLYIVDAGKRELPNSVIDAKTISDLPLAGIAAAPK